MLAAKGKGAFVSESALRLLMAISRILSPASRRTDDHLSRPARAERPSRKCGTWCDDTRGSLADRLSFPCLSCTAWGFSCLVRCWPSG